jgi:hypothetical protein
MDIFEIPEVHPMADGKFVTVPDKSWNALCDTVNKMIKTINAQSAALSKLGIEVRNCDDAISKIAEILEEIYEKVN